MVEGTHHGQGQTIPTISIVAEDIIFLSSKLASYVILALEDIIESVMIYIDPLNFLPLT